jgi:hypothetical protein
MAYIVLLLLLLTKNPSINCYTLNVKAGELENLLYLNRGEYCDVSHQARLNKNVVMRTVR